MRRFIQEKGLITGGRAYLLKTSGMGLPLIPLKWSPALTNPISTAIWTEYTDGAPTGHPEMNLHIKIFRMHRLGIPQDRIAKRLSLARTSFQYHLPKMAALPNSANADLFLGFTVAQVDEKHGGATNRCIRSRPWVIILKPTSNKI